MNTAFMLYTLTSLVTLLKMDVLPIDLLHANATRQDARIILRSISRKRNRNYTMV